MCLAIGHPVKDLERSRLAFLTTRGLPAGACRMLTKIEINKLKAMAESFEEQQGENTTPKPERRGRPPKVEKAPKRPIPMFEHPTFSERQGLGQDRPYSGDGEDKGRYRDRQRSDRPSDDRPYQGNRQKRALIRTASAASNPYATKIAIHDHRDRKTGPIATMIAPIMMDAHQKSSAQFFGLEGKLRRATSGRA